MGKRYVVIWFRFLLTDYMIRRQPDLKGTCFVLTEKQHGRIVVTAVSEAAYQKGIRENMPLADARIYVNDLLVVNSDDQLPERLLRDLAEWCIRFTPTVSFELPDILLLDVSGCTHLWKGEGQYLRALFTRIREFGYTIFAALADTIGAAWAVSHFVGNRIIPPLQQWETLHSLPLHALRIDIETVERFNKLGIRTIGDLKTISPSSIKRRFGDLVLSRLRQAFGEEEEIITPITTISPYTERLPCLEPILTRKGIEIALSKLLEQLCSRLVKENNGLRKCLFKCYRVDSKVIELEISTQRPSNSISHIFMLFENKITTIEPALGIELFVLQAPQVEKLSPALQPLWEPAAIDNKRLSELIDRLNCRQGIEVQRYLPAEHYWPERAYRLAVSLDETLTTWPLNQYFPLIIFTPPVKITVTAPIPDYPPMNFRDTRDTRLHTIVKSIGPRRIESEWWIEERKHRDYYLVEDTDAGRYCIFRVGHYGSDTTEWFLHGVLP
ncbi:protein ImuB [Chitinophaga terrae (ex Kim and Jung 2007)]|uniref:Protein ImuB n=1 Tax=Chitinophaga terrae (ex Kim and Jung 2007) TaxID=408074 RepID=A0A1H4GCG8_9BACT|nr:DNA polymerase Y family protein [Chitinophaga terrae (ex Kim and Jung 2007)]GEP93291.1 protein ImuB [Chitinophaga terrae (ex Kim and Jung 2007)]SEB06991.1 protein ImuB [Chitinophaga terrae (ex Kim and Jung 2007)]